LNISLFDWYSPIKDVSFRFGDRMLERMGANRDTIISIYHIQSVRQDGKFLLGKAVLDVKIKEKPKSKT